MYRTCPRTVRKYGWCGILAIVYACGLAMPSTERAFDELLDYIQSIIGKPKPCWRRSSNAARNRNRGGICLTETLDVLDFYSTRCTYTLDRTKERGVDTNIRRWLLTAVSGKFIIHTARHAVFVCIPIITSQWKIYDQTGVHYTGNVVKGRGILLQKVHVVLTVVDCL